MVDRAARDEMAELIRRYCQDELLSNEMDEGIERITGKTTDATVIELAGAIWGLYDDLVDHKVVATKEEWDFLQRVRLLLATDGRIDNRSDRRWSWLQIPAGTTLTALLWHLGGGGDYWAAAIVGGVVAGAIACAGNRRRVDAIAGAMTPFGSYRELRAARRLAPGFAKARYRGDLRTRRIRHPLVTAMMWLPALAVWAAISPVVLLAEALPWSSDRCSVVQPLV